MDRVALKNPPIVEAILDIDCDLPPGQGLAEMEQAALARYSDRYPRFQRQVGGAVEFEMREGGARATSMRTGIQALQLWQEDRKQLVQVRAQGFSFNRLAPYDGLDAYLPEIERTWRIYAEIASPVDVAVIRLRYINRLILPATDEKVDLEKYLRVGPRLPDEEELVLEGFLHHHQAYEPATGSHVNIVLQAQPGEGDRRPVIFDITAAVPGPRDPNDWEWVASSIQSARRLKNLVFWKGLTHECLKLFQAD